MTPGTLCGRGFRFDLEFRVRVRGKADAYLWVYEKAISNSSVGVSENWRNLPLGRVNRVKEG